METDILVQLIGQLGFPIAACVALFYMCNSFIKQMMSSNEQNQASIKEMSATLSKLDSTLEKIYNKLDQLDDRINTLENNTGANGAHSA